MPDDPFAFANVEMPDGHITGPVAYRGKPGCEHPICTQAPFALEKGMCYGWHCSACDAPCSMQGHLVNGCPVSS